MSYYIYPLSNFSLNVAFLFKTFTHVDTCGPSLFILIFIPHSMDVRWNYPS